MAKKTGYLGNAALKSAGERIEYTAEQILEWKRCSEDPVYFMRKFYKIVHVDRGVIPFDPFAYQIRITETVVGNRFVICKLPRQSGKTTVIAAVLLWYVLFTEVFKIGILAHKEKQAREILARIKMAYQLLPKWLQQGIVDGGWNKGSILLENGSEITAHATSADAIRGGSFNIVYLDEFAHVENNLQEEFFASVFPTISSGQTTKVLITSTPKGMNQFYRIWTDAVNKKNSYVPVDIHWSETPGRDEAWKEETIKNTSARQFEQEFECEFLGSTNTLIAAAKLRKIPYVDPIYTQEGLDVYEWPLEKHSYMLVADTSRGADLDNSAFVVIDISEVPYRLVAKFKRNDIPVILYPNIIHQVAKQYNNAHLLIEINDAGQQVADILHYDLEYENILFTAVGKHKTNMSSGFNKSPSPGIRTEKKVKRIGCANIKTLVEQDKLLFQDYDIIFEFSTFILVKDSYKAEEGKKDDLVMCLVLFGWAANEPFFKDLTNTDIRARIYDDNKKAIEEDLLPIVSSNGRADDFYSEPEPEPWNSIYF